MNRMGNILWGIVFVLVGLIFGLNALEITDINIFFDGWWTLFIIVPCFIDLFSDNDKTGSIIGVIIGVSLFLCCQGYIDFSIIFKLFIPIILVVLGLTLIFKDTLKSKIKEEVKKLNRRNPNKKEYCATFSEQNIDFSNEEFNGCELTSVFGGIKCDLKDAKIDKNCVINVSSIFGEATISVPEGVNVKTVSTLIFGEVIDKRKVKTKDSKVTIYINSTCVFGGVKIR